MNGNYNYIGKKLVAVINYQSSTLDVQYVNNLLRSTLGGLDLTENELIDRLQVMSKGKDMYFSVSGAHDNSVFELVVKSGCTTHYTTKSESGRIVSTTDSAEPAKEKPPVQIEKRDFLNVNMNANDVQVNVNIKAGHMVDPLFAMELSDKIARNLMNLCVRQPVGISLLSHMEHSVYLTLRDFAVRHDLSMDWFEVVIPQLEEMRSASRAVEAEEKAKAALKEEKRKLRIIGGIRSVMKSVRRSHVETLVAVLGDTDAAEACLNEVQAHLNVYYGAGDNIKFVSTREHAESCVNDYITAKIDSLKAAASEATVNNITINVDKDADVELLQETVGDVSRTTLHTNGALPQNQVKESGMLNRVLVVALPEGEGESFQMGDTAFVVKGQPLLVNGVPMKFKEMDLDSHKEPTKSESPCLEGKTGADRVQWILNNVEDAYLSGNLEMYCDFEDIKDWLLQLKAAGTNVVKQFIKLYGFDPLNTNYTFTAQHLEIVNELKEQLQKSDESHKKTAIRLADMQQERDSLSRKATELNLNLNRYKHAFSYIDDTLNPLR